ncbi:hypothetical protein D047_3388B, partial [Vibrio parahaemolyticus VPTS-2010_2]
VPACEMRATSLRARSTNIICSAFSFLSLRSSSSIRLSKSKSISPFGRLPRRRVPAIG